MWKKIKPFLLAFLSGVLSVLLFLLGRRNSDGSGIRKAAEDAGRLSDGIGESTDSAESLTGGIGELEGIARTGSKAADSIEGSRGRVEAAIRRLEGAKEILRKAKNKGKAER